MSDTSLVAGVQDSSKPWTGFGPAESVMDLATAIESGTWIDQALASGGLVAESIGLAFDPLGSLMAAGGSWLIEHIEPLSQALDDLTGDADVVASHAQTWTNMATELYDIAASLHAAIESQTAEWTGDAADAYRAMQMYNLAGTEGLASICDAMCKATEGAGTLVQITHDLVRDIIAELIGFLLIRIPIWIASIAATAGAATPVVVADGVALIAGRAALIYSILVALVQSFIALDQLLNS